MSDIKLEKTFGENTCNWCFAKDETVLRHAGTDTYWHEDCFEAAGDTIHHIIDCDLLPETSLVLM